jgi:hypothetical protein
MTIKKSCSNQAMINGLLDPWMNESAALPGRGGGQGTDAPCYVPAARGQRARRQRPPFQTAARQRCLSPFFRVFRVRGRAPFVVQNQKSHRTNTISHHFLHQPHLKLIHQHTDFPLRKSRGVSRLLKPILTIIFYFWRSRNPSAGALPFQRFNLLTFQ